MNLKKTTLAILLAQALFVAPHVYGKKNEPTQNTEQTENRRTEYSFKQSGTPIKLSPYNTVVYSMTPTDILTMRGDGLYHTKNQLMTLSVIPSGVSYGVVEQDKKGRTKAGFYSTSEYAKKLGELDVKKYGLPSAIAYSPDARKIYVATEQGLKVFEPRKMTLVDSMELPFMPAEMAVSDNGYYLTISSGDRVAVINIEQKKVRRDWSYGVKVTDMTFSEGSSQFAVLTDDGILSVYDTRNFNIKNTIEDLGSGIACAFSNDGKYIFVATSPETLEVINLVRPTDRNTIPVENGGISDMAFIKDSEGNSLLAYTGPNAVKARRIQNLEPHFNKLISDEVDEMMAEWQKMMPGESMEEYRARVNDETRARQRRLFEDEISTRLAGDLLASATMSLGSYDRTNQVLALDFSTMPTIYLPVPESDVTSFKNAGDLVLSDVQYGVLPDDTFEIVYAKVTNKADGKTYEYNNHDRVAMDFMGGDSNVVSLEILQQQQMEELKLQELRAKVVEEAKSASTISNHTNIAVDSRVVPDFDADGNKILNYEVNFTYQVDPEFSASEDFPPGKYIVEESGAANAMLKIVKEAFEGDFSQYIKAGKKLKVVISGTADATPIVRTIPYNGVYGDFEDEPIYENGDLTAITVTKKDGVKENRQLAFLRAEGVKNYLQNNVDKLDEMNADYTIKVDVAEGKGAEFRRITANFLFIDVF
ncbi:MAG: WD40 repeat domain-containing protein [Muribaculaceae bacterium]|nr:WD40 repeat domain-containing protein [Muribaculaceae bacterium]